MLEQGREAALIDGFESLSFRAERGILSAGGGGDGLERRLIETGFDEGAGLVFDETGIRVRRQGNEITLRGAHADGVDLQAVLTRRRLSGSQRVAFEILAVGDQDENLVAAGTAPQRGCGLANGARDIGAAARNGVDVDRAQGFVECAIVEGDGADQKGVAGKGHEAHARRRPSDW